MTATENKPVSEMTWQDVFTKPTPEKMAMPSEYPNYILQELGRIYGYADEFGNQTSDYIDPDDLKNLSGWVFDSTVSPYMDKFDIYEQGARVEQLLLGATEQDYNNGAILVKGYKVTEDWVCFKTEAEAIQYRDETYDPDENVTIEPFDNLECWQQQK